MAEGDTDDPFGMAFARLAQPLARAMVRYGMTIAQATEALKQALITAALAEAGEDATDSRLSLLTGLHRKDVRRLRASEPAPPKRSNMSAAATVLAVWAGHVDFVAKDGVPIKLLPRGRVGTPGFDDLVRATRVDLPPATLLEHVVGEGAVRRCADGRLELVRQTLGPGAGAADKLEAFARNLSAHLSAATANLETLTHFERALHVNRLSEASVAALRDEAHRAAEQLLADLNRRALALQDSDAGGDAAADASGRFVFGAFEFAQDPEGDER